MTNHLYLICKKNAVSEAFELEDKSGDFEWTADVININQEANESLVKKCKSLYDYVRLVGRISDNKKKKMEIGQAVQEAVDWAIKENFLEGFVREQTKNSRGNASLRAALHRRKLTCALASAGNT